MSWSCSLSFIFLFCSSSVAVLCLYCFDLGHSSNIIFLWNLVLLYIWTSELKSYIADFKPSEKLKVFYSGRELEDDSSLAAQDVRPNSLLHFVRTRIHLWPKAQKLPGENKPLRPPGAFKKKSELSVKDGHVFLLE